MDGWKTWFPFWETIFSGAFAVSFREGTRWAPKTSYQWIYWIKTPYKWPKSQWVNLGLQWWAPASNPYCRPRPEPKMFRWVSLQGCSIWTIPRCFGVFRCPWVITRDKEIAESSAVYNSWHSPYIVGFSGAIPSLWRSVPFIWPLKVHGFVLKAQEFKPTFSKRKSHPFFMVLVA